MSQGGRGGRGDFSLLTEKRRTVVEKVARVRVHDEGGLGAEEPPNNSTAGHGEGHGRYIEACRLQRPVDLDVGHSDDHS